MIQGIMTQDVVCLEGVILEAHVVVVVVGDTLQRRDGGGF